MVSNQEDLKTPIQDNVVLPKQLDNFYRKGYEIFYKEEMLSAIWQFTSWSIFQAETSCKSGQTRTGLIFSLLNATIFWLFYFFSLALSRSASRHYWALFRLFSLTFL